MVPGEEDWRRVRDSAVLDVLQFIFLTDRKGRFTSTIKTVRGDLGIWWVRCVFYKITGCDFAIFFFSNSGLSLLLFYFAPFNLFKSHIMVTLG